MFLIPEVVATTYMGVCGQGRNRPCRFSCVSNDNMSLDYVVKFFGSIDYRIICETVASIMAKKLGLNTPDIATVYCDPRIKSAIMDTEAKEAFGKAPGPHFGSLDLGSGVTEMNMGYSLSGRTMEQAIEIFAFDMLIQNADRSPVEGDGRPNILFRGEELFLIDHELSFAFINSIGAQDPWVLRGVGLAERHVFYSSIRKYSSDTSGLFDRFVTRIGDLGIEVVHEAIAAVPEQWKNELYFNKILFHFENIFANVGRFHKGLLEVFA